MPKYTHITHAIASEPWAIDPIKGWVIFHEFVAFAAAGGKYTDEERAAKIGGAKDRSIRESGGGVAIVELVGVMSQRASMLGDISSGGGASADAIGRQIDAAAADPEVKAILLHVDSPGGSIQGTRELAAKVSAARDVKPVIAHVDSNALSAAYWVASQATEIVSTPGGMVGSIGVYTVHEDVSGFQAAEGVKTTLVHAGKYKIEGNPYEALSEEARATLQARVDDAYRDFVGAVAAGRDVKAGEVEGGYGQGRAVSAKAALGAGMIDRIATFDETLARFTRKPDYARRATAASAIARS
jgi:signal peptide peptidase SppA